MGLQMGITTRRFIHWLLYCTTVLFRSSVQMKRDAAHWTEHLSHWWWWHWDFVSEIGSKMRKFLARHLPDCYIWQFSHGCEKINMTPYELGRNSTVICTEDERKWVVSHQNGQRTGNKRITNHALNRNPALRFQGRGFGFSTNLSTAWISESAWMIMGTVRLLCIVYSRSRVS